MYYDQVTEKIYSLCIHRENTERLIITVNLLRLHAQDLSLNPGKDGKNIVLRSY